jgi:Pyruvate/2-oxoacid:ferredoxin oxidoreductase gamma subunit
MGVPVSPRNIFPSNIQGLPTWYEVRVSESGYLGRRGGVDLMVAMNPQTWDKDIAEIEPGGYLFYDSTRPRCESPSSGTISTSWVCRLPRSATASTTDARERQLFKNIVYVGALSALLDVDIKEVEKLIAEQYKGKEKLLEPNIKALNMGRDYAANYLPSIGLKVKRANAVGERIFLEGNSAAALGAVYGGGDCRGVGIPSHRPLHWPKLSPATVGSTGPIRTAARAATPSCRQKTSWLPSAWSLEQRGMAHAHLPAHRAQASLSCRSSWVWPTSQRFQR